MRRILSLVIVLTTLAAAGAAVAQSLPVRVDQATRVSVSSAIRDVVIGNPAIADVTVMDATSVLVTGKRYGVTSLMIVDQRGRTVLNREVVVSGSDDAHVTIYRGPRVSTFACAPTCEQVSGAAPGAEAEAPASQ